MLDEFVEDAIARLRDGGALPAEALGVLLRVYAATGRADVAARLEDALGTATALRCDELPVEERASWLTLFAEAARYTEDERVARVASAISASLAAERLPDDDIAGRAATAAALLSGSSLVGARGIVAAAIDDLERLVHTRYAPGGGLRGCTASQTTAVAAALLAAFDVTGRLAYPMLAEELMLGARGDLASAPPLVLSSAARVLYRLARLHGDDGYRATAVVAPSVDFAAEAASLLDRAAVALESPRERAAHALALAERAS